MYIDNIWRRIEPTETLVSTPPIKEIFTIKDSIKEILPTRREGGLLEHRDPAIVSIFGMETCTCNKSISGNVQSIRYNCVQRDILDEAKLFGIYQEYTLGYALLLINEVVKADIVKGFCGGIYVYIKSTQYSAYKLTLYRFGGLRVILSEIYPGSLLPLGRGILCRSESL